MKHMVELSDELIELIKKLNETFEISSDGKLIIKSKVIQYGKSESDKE